MTATGTQTDTVQEQKIKSLWAALQVAEGQAEKRGLQFGQALYELRENSYHVRRIGGLEGVLEGLEIPKATAYRWIAKYEESIGTRPPKPDSDICPSETSCKVAQSETTRSVVDLPETPARPFESEPTPTPTPSASSEEKDREQLCFLVKRLESLTKALQQVADESNRWSQYEEYAEVVSLGKKIAGLLKLL